jgi:hypothetical protein
MRADRRGVTVDRCKGHPPFTLRHVPIVIAVIGFPCAIMVKDPSSVIPLSSFTVLCISIYLFFALVPLRFRLTVEVVIIFALLALSARIWRPAFYLDQGDRADRLARLAVIRPDEAGSPQEREFFRREFVWFSRRAFMFRCQAWWQGLIGGPSNRVRFSRTYTEQELVEELGILQAVEKHEMRVKQEFERPQGEPK